VRIGGDIAWLMIRFLALLFVAIEKKFVQTVSTGGGRKWCPCPAKKAMYITLFLTEYIIA